MMAAEMDFRGFIAGVNLLTIDSTGDQDRRPYTLDTDEDRINLTSLRLGLADVTLIGAWLATRDFRTKLRSIQYDDGLIDDKGNSLLHLVLQHQAPTHVAMAVMDAEPTACTKKNYAGHTPLEDAIDGRQAVLAREMFHNLAPQEQEALKPKLRDWFSTAFLDLLGQLVNESKALAIDAMMQLTAMLDFNLVNETFVSHDGFAHVLPLLCHPDVAVYTVASEAIATACQDDGCVNALVRQANGGMTRRLVDILILEKRAAQVHAATALGRASKTHEQDVQKVLSNSADVAELLAILTVSGDATLALLAEDLFKLVAKDNAKKKMRERGIQRMFEKPWPSAEYRKYEQSGWTKPSDKQRDCNGMDLIKLRVFVEGEGEGTIRKFHKSRVGTSKHEIDLVLKGTKQVALKRKGNNEREWLVQSNVAASPTRLIWQRNGGNATTTKMYTRGASNNDVCMWMYSLGGQCRHYAGLFSWIFDNEKVEEAAGSVLLKMATNQRLGTQSVSVIRADRQPS